MSPNSAFGRRLDVSEQAHISSTLKVGQRKKLALNEFFNTTSEKYQKKVDALNIKMKREFERRRAANAAELAVLQQLLVFLNLVSVEDLMKNISNLEPIENFNNATFASKIQRCAQLSALPVQASDLGSVPMRSEDYYKQNRPYWQPLDQLLNLNFDVTAKRRDLSKLQNSHNFLSGLAHEGLSELFDDIKGLEIDLSYQTEQSLRENSIFSHLLINLLTHLKLPPQSFGRQPHHQYPLLPFPPLGITMFPQNPQPEEQVPPPQQVPMPKFPILPNPTSMLFQSGGQVTPQQQIPMPQFPIHPMMGVPPFFQQNMQPAFNLQPKKEK